MFVVHVWAWLHYYCGYVQFFVVVMADKLSMSSTSFCLKVSANVISSSFNHYTLQSDVIARVIHLDMVYSQFLTFKLLQNFQITQYLYNVKVVEPHFHATCLD